MVNISRPSGVNVGINNPGTTVYIKGNESIDGSLRYQVVPNGSIGVTEIQERKSGLWQPASFKTGADSLLVGTLVSLSVAGTHLMTVDDSRAHFLARSSFEDGVSTSLAIMLNAFSFSERVILSPDEDGSFIGTSISTVSTNTFHVIAGKFYFKTSTIAASQPVTIRVWNGTDDTGLLIFEQTYPASEFPENTEISLSIEGFVEFSPGDNVFTRITSDAQFSLRTNIAETVWWFAADFSLVRDDDLLQTTQFISGDSFDQGDWTTQDRKVFVCNVTGIQTGTFNDNLEKWDILEPPTMHDRQDIILNGPITTTSTTFVDIPGAQLTTKDLGSEGNYQVWVNVSVQQNTNNSSVTFRALLDGVAGEVLTISFGPAAANNPTIATIIGQNSSISSGSLVEFQWLVSGGEGQINNLTSLIDGIRTDRIIT